jgi:threonine dehydrogenase-like Zn-dependent dehydrogenase
VVVDQESPRPGPGQVLVAIRAAGICGTDLHSYRARVEDYPKLAEFIPGHEPCGEIAEVGPDVDGWATGDRVVVYHRITCLRCAYCRAGARHLCVDHKGVYGFGPDGADAELMVANVAELMTLPDDYSYVEGVLFACQVGTAYSPLKAMNVGAGDTILVSGLGPVGLLGVMLARALGARVVGADPSPARRALAERLGAAAALDPEAEPLARAVEPISAGGVDKLLETSGSPAAHASIVKVLRPNGAAALVGLGAREVALKLAPLISKQLHVFGTSIYPFEEFGEIAGFVRARRVPIQDVVAEELTLEEAPAGFEIADRAETGKVVFRLD